MVNNLSTETGTFTGGLTFRQRKKWISELDLCIISKELISNIERFEVDQNPSLPSNHAPISIQLTFPERDLNLQQILTRSTDIETHPCKPKPICKPPVTYKRLEIMNCL